jgi:hypothetical protein
MKFGFLVLAVVTLVVAAVWLVSAPRESTPGTQQPPLNNSPPTAQTQQTNKSPQQPVEVTWRGYISAVVVDFVDPTSGQMTGGYTEWFFDFDNGTTVRLDLTNATIRLRDHFIEYYLGRDRPVYVRGIWNGTVLKALEIYDYFALSGYVVGRDVLFVNGSSVTYFFLMLDNGTLIPLVEPPPAYLVGTGERVEAELVYTEEGVGARVLAPREPTQAIPS